MDPRDTAPLVKDAGVTIVELLITTVLIALMGTMALGALRTYAQNYGHQAAADELVSGLRLAAQRSLSEGRTFCVHVDPAAETWTVFRRSCSTAGAQVGPVKRLDRGLDITTSAFSAPASTACPATGQCVYFFPRGTAAGGSTTVRRASSDITITVEGLTSRVDRS